MKTKKLVVLTTIAMAGLTLSGCTLNSKFMSFSSTTNSADTGHFSTVKVTYQNGKTRTFDDVTVYPYNNGGDDSTGGRVEIRDGGSVFVMPNNAQLELVK